MSDFVAPIAISEKGWRNSICVDSHGCVYLDNEQLNESCRIGSLNCLVPTNFPKRE